MASAVTVVTALLVAAVIATVALGATPAAVSRTAWPGATVSYTDLTGSSGYHVSVSEAVSAWNAARVGIRFVPAAAAAAAADVRIVFRTGRCLSGRAGSATFGFQPAGTVVVGSCPAVLRPLLVAHELGRVLGLPVDNTSCSLMNGAGKSDGVSFALPAGCSRFAPPAWIASLVDPGTVTLARQIYTRPAGPATITVTDGVAPRIGWRQLAGSGAASTVVLRARTCPTATELLRRTATVIYEKPAFPGLHWIDDTTVPKVRASYCYSVFTVNRWFRTTRYPARIGFRYDRTPIAASSAASASFQTGVPVTFSDSSTDAFGAIVRWRWEFGDPGSGSADTIDTADPALGRTAQHLYAQPGSYTVTLTVTDVNGASDTATTTVVVQAPTG
jgi:hypothetical protein